MWHGGVCVDACQITSVMVNRLTTREPWHLTYVSAVAQTPGTIIIPVQNTSNNSPEDIPLCQLAQPQLIKQWHALVTGRAVRASTALCSASLHDYGSLVTSLDLDVALVQQLEAYRTQPTLFVCVNVEAAGLFEIGWMRPTDRASISWPASCASVHVLRLSTTTTKMSAVLIINNMQVCMPSTAVCVMAHMFSLQEPGATITKELRPPQTIAPSYFA